MGSRLLGTNQRYGINSYRVDSMNYIQGVDSASPNADAYNWCISLWRWEWEPFKYIQTFQ